MRKWLFLALGIIIVDQISKLYMENLLKEVYSIAILPFLNLSLAYNLGAAFSVLAEADGWQRYALSSIAIAASVFIIYLLRKHHHEVRFSLSLSFILGGAVGNLIDRIAYGHVIDFIDFYIKEWHWPAFNIADSAICIGAVLMVIDAFLTSDRKQRHA